MEIVQPSEESETDPQATETETEEVLEPISVDLGIVEEIYDFVEMFEHSTISGTEQAAGDQW